MPQPRLAPAWQRFYDATVGERMDVAMRTSERTVALISRHRKHVGEFDVGVDVVRHFRGVGERRTVFSVLRELVAPQVSSSEETGRVFWRSRLRAPVNECCYLAAWRNSW